MADTVTEQQNQPYIPDTARKKLDVLAEKLLDTGKRNNLVNCSMGARSFTIQVLLPSPQEILTALSDDQPFTVFDTAQYDENNDTASDSKPASDKDEDTSSPNENKTPSPSTQKETSSPTRKEAYLNKYSDAVGDHQALIWHESLNPRAALRRIAKKSKEFLEETGLNVTYMAFGFIEWQESESSHTSFYAPLLLMPVQMEQPSITDPISIAPSEDEVTVNPTFLYKVRAEYNIKLPQYQGDESLEEYFESVQQTIDGLHWKVVQQCAIGLFSFQKINMYKDLEDNADAILSNPNICQILGVDTGANWSTPQDSPKIENPLIDLHTVVDADSSQIEAIEMAKSGKSFVLQGPPGTGKSQTITNIIAECLYDGKKVLFVSEKLAALNVVYNKLKNVNLSEFCLELHSHKANKTDVVNDICHTIRAERSTVTSAAHMAIEEKRKAQHLLDDYEKELHSVRHPIEKSLYQLYESYAALRSAPDVKWPIPQIKTRNEADLSQATDLLEQYVNYIPLIGYDYTTNPWYGFVRQDTSLQARNTIEDLLRNSVALLEKLVPLQQEIVSQYDVDCKDVPKSLIWAAFFEFASISQILTPGLLQRDHFQAVNDSLQRLKDSSAKIVESRSFLESVCNDGIYELDGVDYYDALINDYRGVLQRLFSKDYKQLISNMSAHSKNGKRLSYREAVAIAEQLAQFQQQSDIYDQEKDPAETFLGSAYHGIDTDWDYVINQMGTLHEILLQGVSFDELSHRADFSDDQENFAHYARAFKDLFSSTTCDENTIRELSEYFDPTKFDILTESSDALLNRLTRCLNSIDMLINWCLFRDLMHRLSDEQLLPYIKMTITNNIDPECIVDAFRKQFYAQWIDSIISATPTLFAFKRSTQDNAIRTFRKKDNEQFSINQALIREKLSNQRPSQDFILPESDLSKLFREERKKRKKKNIRQILSTMGDLVQRVKPCFLMSPLSVSTLLGTNSVHFDVVIFDEASQIFPQDAIGAIYRAKQLIVAGDSKQMPPSNFFNTTIELDDSDDEVEDITDYESILDLCSTSMPQIQLRWHYRSRCEQLIAFSNHHFYDDGLITFPAASENAPGNGVEYQYVNGTFDRRATHTNRKEAEQVVNLIYQHIERYPERSLGIVAFSAAQQNLIDDLLMQRRQKSPEQEWFFMGHETEPFFIKNLETVQGDERDTIIFSIAYGLDKQGKLLFNFGPLNRAGGERRLNVAITRAKYNVQVVSSMHYTDIDLKRTKSEGARLLREYLNYAEHGSDTLESTLQVAPFDQFDSGFELEVCNFLRDHGFAVDTQVGCSGFRIDLGLKRPNSSDYVLAIECDGATYHSSKNARDRDRLRQEILENMGWKFYRIWSTDWFRNKSLEQQRLLEAASNAVHSVRNPLGGIDNRTTSGSLDGADNTENGPDVTSLDSSSTDVSPLSVFEETVSLQDSEFPLYKTADIPQLVEQYSSQNCLFRELIKAILQVEAPLSEELLLRRIVKPYFGQTRITERVRRDYERCMYGCEFEGIRRRGGFLYLGNCKISEIRLRRPNDADPEGTNPEGIRRDISEIAPEELAAGMLEILGQIFTVDKNSLYRALAKQCGVTRLGKNVTECMEQTLQLLVQENDVTVDGDQITLK